MTHVPGSRTSTRRPTLRDVAECAGVSLGTASNAFGRPALVSGGAHERVLAAARALGYAGPDPAARTLRTGRTGALGLVFTDSLRYAFTDTAATLFLRGVAAGVEERGAGLVIVPASPAPAEAASLVRESAVDGFLVYSIPTGDPRGVAALERSLPIVTVDQPRHPGTPFVGIDDRAAARGAAEHVRRLGHARVAV